MTCPVRHADVWETADLREATASLEHARRCGAAVLCAGRTPFEGPGRPRDETQRGVKTGNLLSDPTLLLLPVRNYHLFSFRVVAKSSIHGDLRKGLV